MELTVFILSSLLLFSICGNVYAYCIALPERHRERTRLQNIISAITQTSFECTEKARDTVARCNEVIKQFEKNGSSKKEC